MLPDRSCTLRPAGPSLHGIPMLLVAAPREAPALFLPTHVPGGRVGSLPPGGAR